MLKSYKQQKNIPKNSKIKIFTKPKKVKEYEELVHKNDWNKENFMTTGKYMRRMGYLWV